MKSPLGFGLAIAATASLAFAGNGPNGEKKGGDSPPNNLKFQEPKVTFKPGKGITFDGGEAFSLNLRSYFQVKWYFISQENNRDINSFRARRVRTSFSGHVWNEDITYKMQLDFIDSDGTSVKDIWFNYNFYNTEDYTLGVRAGVQKMRSGRQADNSAQKLEFVERSLATRTFADARSTGALLHGAAMNDENGGKKLHWHAGIMNHDTAGGSIAAAAEATNRSGLVPNSGNNEVNFTFGVRFDPMGEMGVSEGDLEHSGAMSSSVGINFFVGNTDLALTGVGDVDTTTLNVQAALKTGGGIAAQGEVWLREDDQDGGTDADSQGWYIQSSYTSAPGSGTQYSAGARIGMVDFDDAPILMNAAGMERGQADPILGAGGTAGAIGGVPVGAQGDVLEFQAMCSAYYHKHNLKSQVVYTFQEADASGVAGKDTNHGLDLMFTLVF